MISHDAIEKSTPFMRSYWRKHVVDMDLSKCFDLLSHELILKGITSHVRDDSILKLIECKVLPEKWGHGVGIRRVARNNSGQSAGRGDQSVDCQYLSGPL